MTKKEVKLRIDKHLATWMKETEQVGELFTWFLSFILARLGSCLSLKNGGEMWSYHEKAAHNTE